MLSIGKAYPIVPVEPVRYKRKQDNSYKTFLPPISLETASRSYFIHNNQVYSVSSCLTHIFVEAVRDVHAFRQLALLKEPHLDLAARWYILVVMVDAGKPLTLYSSRQEAERTIKKS